VYLFDNDWKMRVLAYSKDPRAAHCTTDTGDTLTHSLRPIDMYSR